MKEQSVTRFFYELRNLAAGGQAGELLKALHARCGGQWVYSIHQDYEVWPQTPELSEVFFYPEWWKRMPIRPEFPGIQEFCWDQGSPFHFIHSSLELDGEVRHLLVIKGDEDFSDEDRAVLDYACLLTGFVEDLPAASESISIVMGSAYEGTAPERIQDGMFPDQGFGLVLFERGGKGILKQQGYLGYRLHRRFEKRLRYCFYDNTHLLLFADTPDMAGMLKQLAEIIGLEDGDIVIGVSGCYPVEEMHLALGEARHAAEVGNLMDDGRQVFFHSEMGIFRLLDYPGHGSPVGRLLGQMTEKMSSYPMEKQLVLSDTMRHFVQNHFNYQKTADEMYTHVNTIRYRINLLEELWQCDLRREENRLLFEVISQLLPLWMKETGYGKTDAPSIPTKQRP